MQTTYIFQPGLPAPIEARVVDPEQPGYPYSTGRDWFVAEQLAKYGGDEMPVTVRSALSWTPIFACIRYISGSIASLNWRVYQFQADGRTKLPIEENISWTLDMQANPEMTAFSWREVMLKDALSWGNGYAEIERTMSGKPMWLWRIDPQRVTPYRDGNGPLYYEVTNPGGNNSYLDAANVFHLKGLGEDGLVGLSPIQMFRRSIQLGVNQQGYAASFFRRGPLPGGVLTLPGGRDPKKDTEDREQFERTYGGTRNAGRVIVLRNGATFNQLTLPNTDAQLVEAINLSGHEVCRIYGVPPHKIALMDASTNNNIEHQAIEAVQDCLKPWARRLETEADTKLFGRVQTGRRVTKLSLQDVLQADKKTQAEANRADVTAGVRMLDEVREELGLNPLPDKLGSTPITQGAMVSLERVINPPEPTPPAQSPSPFPDTQPSTEPQPGESNDPAMEPPTDRIREPAVKMLAMIYSQWLRIENEKANRAEKAGKLDSWAQEFYGNGHAEHIAAEISGIIEMLAIAAHLEIEAAEKAEYLAKLHVQASEKTVTDRADWQTFRAWQQARANVEYLMSFRGNDDGIRRLPPASLPAVQPVKDIEERRDVGNITIVLPEQPAPVVNIAPVAAPDVIVNVASQPPAVINNSINLPEQPPPPPVTVNAPIENIVNIPPMPEIRIPEPAAVNITTPAPAPVTVNAPVNVSGQDDPVKRTLEYDDPMGKPSSIIEETQSGKRRRKKLTWDATGKLLSIEHEWENG